MFWRGVLGYLPVNLVQALAGFGSIFLFTRLLSPSDYGAYALALSVTSLVSTSMFTWIEASVARFHAAELEDPSHLLATLYRTFALTSLALPAVAAVILFVLPISGGLKLAVAAGLGAVVFRSLLRLAQERRRAAGEVMGFAVYDMAQTGMGFAAGAALALAGLGGAAPLAGAGLASAICLVFALPPELARMKGGRFDHGRLGGYASYGLPLAMSLLMSLALATTDRFVLAGFMDEATVGAYHAGYSLSNRTLDVMFVWLGMAGQPACILALERGGRAALMRTAREQAGFMLLVALPAAAGLALVARPLADVMIGEALRAKAAEVTPWIALSAVFAGFTTHYLHTAFSLARRTRLLFLVIALPALANLGLTLVLIPRFGLDGAMWATTASYGLGMLAAYGFGRRVLPLPIPWADLGRSGVAVAAMALVVSRMPAWGGVPELAAKAAIGALVYVGLALALDAGEARSRGGAWLQGLRARMRPELAR